MNTHDKTSDFPQPANTPARLKALQGQYGMERFAFFGHHNALHDRHLIFDNVLDASTAGNRARFEALARSVRDILSQRWIKTDDTYTRKDVKRATSNGSTSTSGKC
jgi:glycogen phosphorylase